MIPPVHLVGGGAGDPALLTCRAHTLLLQAEVVVGDAPTTSRLLEGIPETVERLDAGSVEAEDIPRLLAQKAREGKRVVRLYPGDPFLSGSGTREALRLAEEGIPFQVVPGISPVTAALAEAGIPLAGTEEPLLLLSGGLSVRILPYPGETVDGFLARLAAPGAGEGEEVAGELLARGPDARTPAAAIPLGGPMPGQVVSAPLGQLLQAVREAGVSSPFLVVVGEAVRLREHLAWRQRLPLFGARVLITRARHQASELAVVLRSLGAETVELPLLTLQPADDPTPLEEALLALPSYEWLLFTSANAVDYFFQALFRQERDLRELYGIRLVAIGPATAERLKDRGLLPSLLPEDSHSEGILAALRPLVSVGERVLLPRAQVGREVLPRGLRELGLHVDEVPVYKNTPAADLPTDLPRYLEENGINWLPFASSSAVERFVPLLKGASLPPTVHVAAIGPVTADRARELGLPVEVVAEKAAVSSLVEAMAAFWERSKT